MAPPLVRDRCNGFGEEDALFNGFGLILLSMEKDEVVAISPLQQDGEGPVYRLVILSEKPRLISELPAPGAPRHVNNTGYKSDGGLVLFAGRVVSISDHESGAGSPISSLPTSQPEWFDDTVVITAGNIVVTSEWLSGDGARRPQRATKTAAAKLTGKEYITITAEQHGDILEALAEHCG